MLKQCLPHAAAVIVFYLYDARYAGESGELIGSGFTGGRRHQTKEGGLQDTTEDSITAERVESLDHVSLLFLGLFTGGGMLCPFLSVCL